MSHTYRSSHVPVRSYTGLLQNLHHAGRSVVTWIRTMHAVATRHFTTSQSLSEVHPCLTIHNLFKTKILVGRAIAINALFIALIPLTTRLMQPKPRPKLPTLAAWKVIGTLSCNACCPSLWITILNYAEHLKNPYLQLIAIMSSHKGKTLKSYSIKRKLEIISEMDTPLENGSMPSINSILKKYGIDQKCLGNWRKQWDAGAFEEVNADASVKIHEVRRLSGGGCKSPYVDIDQKLYAWVMEQNQKGLVVKDKYLTCKALRIAAELDVQGFSASKGYISRFKKRNGLVARARRCTVRSVRTVPRNVPSSVPQLSAHGDLREGGGLTYRKSLPPG